MDPLELLKSYSIEKSEIDFLISPSELPILKSYTSTISLSWLKELKSLIKPKKLQLLWQNSIHEGDLQGVGSTTKWKPRLSNYKSHIKKKIKKPCKIVQHFLSVCTDPDLPHKYLRFVLIDCLNNVKNLSSKEIDDLLLKKEKFWIGTLQTVHSGLNSSHDWNRVQRVVIP